MSDNSHIPGTVDHAKRLLAKCEQQRDDLREALDSVLRLERIERVNGSTSWIATCNEMRTIAADALANLNKTGE
ncbi:MAG: hypothetical protein ACR2OV_00285 [Hyphomicrobiaceae bacterium]